jgi:acyl-CoA synthetase (AMP-forming)/AMP-acid ligase II
LKAALRTFGCELFGSYGLTETTGTVVRLEPEDHDPDGPREHLLRSAGKPYPWVDMRIVDPETGAELAADEWGEVWLRAPNVMAGYWGREQETAAALTPDGWLRTGDGGFVDDEGYLFLTDRIKDMIVSGGENVYSVEVENALYEHPAVLEAAVFGLADERWGEAVHAVVVVREGTAPTPELAEELRDHCRALIAGYKVPKAISLRTEPLPKSGPGKILKRQLRDEQAAARAVPTG